MATKKITVTLQEEQLAQIRRLVEQGGASLSSFVQKAVALALDDLAGWEQSLDALLQATGGAPQAGELAWLESVFRQPAA